eukprot:TRINITY_DN1554_c0_g1_i2.p1 TRINITY_DN1554_c0_g1~~TRINITY_DN1554_c0_g1_i2.p1  ORF type:complete len:90 (-),score=43.77 TRINITY_DN1554_c0_g1_i2:187-456(-)
MDKKEDKAEREAIAAADPVSKESIAATEAMLEGKIAKQKMDNQAADEKKKELADVAALDGVNEDVKNVVQMSGSMQQKKMMNMDDKRRC